jgi:hypothetical protein
MHNNVLTIKPTIIDSSTIFVSGWKNPEHDFIWALGPVSIIDIPLGMASEFRGKNLRFSIDLNVPITTSNPGGSRLTFMLGSTVLCDQTVKERTRIIFYAPAPSTAPRLNILHITNHSPASIDGLDLGFQLYAIEIEELPILRMGEVMTFGQGSPHTGTLGSGWKDPEAGFCWSFGTESILNLFFETEAWRQEEWDNVQVAEIVLSVSFHDRVDPEPHHWHILDVMSNQLLLHRHIHPGLSGIMAIHVYVPIGPEASVELILIDHCATSPALLGNDPDDHTVLGFQLVSLELLQILTLHSAGMPALASLFESGSRLAMPAWAEGNNG